MVRALCLRRPSRWRGDPCHVAPSLKKSQSGSARCRENRPECGSGNSDRGSLSSGPRAGAEEDLVTACNRSCDQYGRYDYAGYQHYAGYQQYGCNDVSRSYQHYLHSYYGQTGYAASEYYSSNYPSNWPTLGQASPMSTPARPPYWANCRCMDLPRLPAVSPRTRLWAPGWTRGI